ncbi:MAG: DUF669 domain-containing protein [Alphaproteobacteria bacterium]|nr:MAG: DUF669 domain-containing protein [Alphaproteobacteria bacterium]
MANLNGFNAHEVEPNVGFDPIPAGKYLCIIANSEMKPTKNGVGEYLQLELEIIDGPHKGRKIWDRLTLKHPNELTVRIARGALSSICRAVGVMAPKDSVELHNLPLLVSVGCKKREDTGDTTNYVKGYARREAANAAPGSASSNGSVPPWKR